jgi:hypothetical protein
MWRCSQGFQRVVAAALLLSSCLAAAPQSAIDLDGNAVNPFAADSNKIIVLVFLRRDCPVSSGYAPFIQKIAKQYADRARFWLLFPDKTDAPTAIRKYLSDYGYRLPALRDPDHRLVKLGRVEVTPEVAVFDRDHKLVYDGRIDDWFVALGKARPAPTTHELDDAIRAALSGKVPARTDIRGVGCYISDLD